MKISRQQLLPSVALLVVLVCAIGYLAQALARREASAPPGAAQPSAQPAPVAAAAATAPLPTPSRDPFAAPRPSAAGNPDAASEVAPDGSDQGSAASGATPEGSSRPRLVGVVVGERTVAAIRVGEQRYHVVAGDLVPGLGRVVQVGRNWVVIKGGSGTLRLTIEGEQRS